MLLSLRYREGERFEAGLPQDFSLWLENLRGLANGSA